MKETAVYIFFVTAGALLYLIIYYIYFAGKFLRYKSRPPVFDDGVSVIVAAKNESANLQRHIPLWLGQDYPSFELVIIDDRSTDDTEKVLETFENHPQIKIVRIPFQEWKTFIGNKKYALTMGIKAARYPYLLFTDADCRPASPHWIRYMTAHFKEGKEIILGYGKYERRKGWLNALVRYETLMTALQYFGFALRGKAYMGVGRNLAYTKEVFFRNDGFKSHFEILSGDDDLFVNENATPDNTAVCYRPEAHTVSLPPASWKSWFKQKRRHYSTARHYRFVHRMLLGMYALARFLFFTGTLVLLFMPDWRPVAAGMVFVWLLTHTLTVYKGGNKLQEGGLWWRAWMLEGMLLLFQISVFIAGIFKKPQHWD